MDNVEVWVDRWAEGCVEGECNGGVFGPLLIHQKKREKLHCLLLHWRKKKIYEVFVKQKKKENTLLITTTLVPIWYEI